MATQLGLGHTSYAQYGWETALGTPPIQANIDKAFGHDLKLTKNAKGNPESVYDLGGLDAQKIVHKKYEGTWNADFTYSAGYFLRAVLGEAPTDAGAGPYTHTWNSTKGIIPSSSQKEVDSIAIELGNDLDTDSVITLQGCRVTNFTLTAAVGEIVRAKLDGIYIDETEGTSLDSSFATESEEPVPFSEATIQVGGTTLNDVQSVDLSISYTRDSIFGLGSRFATKMPSKKRVYGLNVNLPYESAADLLEKFYGGGTGPVAKPALQSTAVLTLTNGEAGTALRSTVITLANLSLNEHNLDYSPGEMIPETVPLTAKSLTSVVYTDNTAVSL